MDFLHIDNALEQLNSATDAELLPGCEIDYDPDFIELENLLASSPEQQYGDTIIPAAEPDWAKALPLAMQLLGKSLDFRVAVIIARCLTHREGLSGAVKGIQLVRALVNGCWAVAFPSLEFDGEYDSLLRSNAIAPLGSMQGLLGDLRHSTLSIGQVGTVSLGSIDKILGGTDEDQPVRRDQMAQALTETLSNRHPELLQLQQLLLELEQLNAELSAVLGPEDRPDLSSTIRFLQQIVPQKPSVAADEPPADEHSDAPATVHTEQTGVPSSVRNRADAIAMLDIVCEYLEHHESANPAPHLIRRARNMIGQDFFTILKDIAPDGVSQAEHITGLHQ
ncbi:type VI secretion system protein TssA [Gilvimarinus japonicus]|uniref:ImpA family type VI secretion system protein n=1 Tax=Gilvimarinus japonicus TaxID=1796469 RepID=A0ABV7HQE7_9GAMM